MMDGSNEEELQNGAAEAEPAATEQPVEQQAGEPEPQGAVEPSNLEDAFKYLREQNKGRVESPVQAEPEPGAEQPGPEPVGDLGQVEPAGLGGSPDPAPQVDYSAYEKDLVDRINREAVERTRELFEKEGIKKISVSDLMRRDPNTGEIKFDNPDAGYGQNRDGETVCLSQFATRAEAQQFVDAYNKQLDAEFLVQAQKVRGEIARDHKPTIEFLRFAPKMAKLDEDTKMVLDQIVSPYAIVRNGQVVGYDCDLGRALGQAESMVAKLRDRFGASAKQEPQKTVQTPATDMKSHGGTQQMKEPKNLEEAMRMVQARKRKKGGR